MNYNFKYVPPKNFINSIDYLNIINENLSMREICEFYGITVNRANKALCPFHNDTHNSLHIYKKKYYCFTCSAHGNIIDFICNYFNLSFNEAIKKINNDFNLNLLLDSTGNVPISEALLKKRKLAEANKLKRAELVRNYDCALAFYIALDKIIMEEKNACTGEIKPLSDDYIMAIKNIDYAYYQFEIAESELKKFDRKERENE